MQQDFTSIGIIGKPHGTSGAFHFKLTAVLLEEGDLPNVLFLKHREGILPFFVEEYSLKNEYQGTIRFEGVINREQGMALVNAELLVKNSDFENYFELEEENYLLGFTVVDKQYGDIGKIIEITDNTMQEVAVVQYGLFQVMFPLVENFILEEKEEEKILYVELPDGLIDAYTNKTEDEHDED